jgi:hypothetical protein
VLRSVGLACSTVSVLALLSTVVVGEGGRRTATLRDEFFYQVPDAVSLAAVTQLYTTSHRFQSSCLTQCLVEGRCFYVTYNAATNDCALYTSGSTSYSTVGWLVFVVTKKIIQVRHYLSY